MRHDTTFQERVWRAALSIPQGKVTTYGELAKAGGAHPLAARSITAMLSKYPNQSLIPYHRIVYAGGRVWLPSHGAEERLALYRKEGIIIEKGRVHHFRDKLHTFG